MNESLFGGQYPVTDEHLDFYQENGYVRMDGILTGNEVEHLRGALADAMEHRKGLVRDIGTAPDDRGDDKHEKILQMLNLWENYDAFKPFSHSQRLAGVAAKLTRSEEIRIFHDQALVKEPGPSAPSPWHQDQPYWPTKEHSMLSIWVALDDVTIHRGCMQFIPGSHKWGELPPVSFTDGEEAMDKMLNAEQKAVWNPVPVELKAGDCTWHNGLTFHFANANTTPWTRRALTIVFIPNDVRYAAEDKMVHPLTPTITSQKGELLRGSVFKQLV